MTKLTEDQLEELRRQVRDADNVKSVLNSKGWKETVVPHYMQLRDKLIEQGNAGLNPMTGQFTPTDPNMAIRAMWTINGMDSFMRLLRNIVDIGEIARKTLRESDTTPRPESPKSAGQ
jgi:hypothetical protein